MSVDTFQLNREPDIVFYNGRIYTVDARAPWVEAIAIQDDIILAIGSNTAILALAGAETGLIDLAGGLVLPGLCDAHIHMHAWAMNLERPPLAFSHSKAEMMSQIAEYAVHKAADAWIVCQGWNESWWGEQDFFTAAELDVATPHGQPAIAYRSDMHIAVANNAALHAAGIGGSTPNPPGGLIDRDGSGKPTGVLREQAIGLVSSLIPAPMQDQLAALVLTASSELYRLGITAIHDQRIKDGQEGAAIFGVYSLLRDTNKLHLRVNSNIAAHDLPQLAAMGLRSGFGDKFLRLGHVKIFADGSLGSRTAWMIEPFKAQSPAEQPNFGVVVTPPEQMAAEFYRAQQLGFPVSVHAIGDRVNRVVLDLFEELAPLLPPLAIPHRIEHVQTISPDDIPRLAQLNITASVQPIHLTDDRELTDRYWGERGRYTYAFRSLLDSGALLAFGSDAPVADPNPFLGIHAALVRHRPDDALSSWQPQECLSLDEIVYAYTLGAAKAAGWDTVIGSLSPGKVADLILLDRDIFALAQHESQHDQIAETKIMSTYFGGKLVYQAPS